ncbi:MAG: transcriptional repressor [Bacteroidota bacterium]
MAKTRNMLSQYGLRATQTREEILGMFMRRDFALSQPEIEKALAHHCDRVTIYRTLTTFMEKGLVHKVLDDSGAMKYALCTQSCASQEPHQHDHVHFKCEQCGKTTCLDDAHLPALSLPAGYQVTETHILVHGKCPQCS